MSDVSARHVARDQDGVLVVWTYRWIEHRAPATGADWTEITRPGSPATARQRKDQGGAENGEDHLTLSLVFDNLLLITFQ